VVFCVFCGVCTPDSICRGSIEPLRRQHSLCLAAAPAPVKQRLSRPLPCHHHKDTNIISSCHHNPTHPYHVPHSCKTVMMLQEVYVCLTTDESEAIAHSVAHHTDPTAITCVDAIVDGTDVRAWTRASKPQPSSGIQSACLICGCPRRAELRGQKWRRSVDGGLGLELPVHGTGGCGRWCG